ncbi:Protein of unknown function, partial [Gryllus bimaculatus]
PFGILPPTCPSWPPGALGRCLATGAPSKGVIKRGRPARRRRAGAVAELGGVSDGGRGNNEKLIRGDQVGKEEQAFRGVWRASPIQLPCGNSRCCGAGIPSAAPVRELLGMNSGHFSKLVAVFTIYEALQILPVVSFDKILLK